ncbi:hypothetical protein [Streptomyces sporangiiformans]|uniref:Lysine transporter LysE n=1 Tax=Streptomyces sporangiiformans TaxID=2315329 RepID=A0A505DSC2_9ACTN|nr:hypothetical protein [Streptomyces sporangiiformans]TPQ24063.1 hypothetical protein FGD71_000845 [Streptomyces sporangiiformans]
MDLVLWVLTGSLIGGEAMYALVRRDLGSRRAFLVAAATVLALGIGWWFALYGVVVGLAAAALAYAVTRSRIGIRRALLTAGGSYLAVVAGFVVLIYGSLETM